MISGAMLNILDFGAIPNDNTKSAVNKTALQNAIAYGIANNILEISIPGVFYMDGDITIVDWGVTISGLPSAYRYYNIGQTIGSTIIFTSGSVGFDLNTAPPTYPNSDYFCLRDITLDGNSTVPVGVWSSGAKVFQNATIQYFTTTGLRLDNLTNSTLVNQSSLLNNGIGLEVLGQGTTVFSVTDTNIRNNTVGIYMEGGKGVRFENLVIESNTSFALYINVPAGQNVGNVTFERCWFENNNFVGNIQQVRLEGADAIPDLYMLTFSHCLFDAASNTSSQDLYMAAGLWTRFDRCQFSNLVSTGIELTTKVQYAQFFNCERGANPISPKTYINDNGYATTFNNNNFYFVGPNLVGSAVWTNVSYGGFTSTGNQITTANSAGGPVSATIPGQARGKGQTYVLQIQYGQNSGQAATLKMTNGDNTIDLLNSVLIVGLNTFYFTETVTGSGSVITVSNTAATSWGMSNNLIEYETARGFIQYDAG